MSRRADITLACWDGEHNFRLRIGELITLQEKCDAGPYHVARRLGDGTWMVGDIRETLRLGLIGAGVAQEDARRLIEQHVDRVPLIDNVLNAQSVILAAVMGAPEERLGESQAATDPSPS
ncbi:gene transfer agent family protein [Aureimonas glaciei]|uniref:Gene transfer agent family protein n=1 Tax=Aureimonas glaciei TaxID=1776957 RepID=A0A916Y4Z1_9HYPH|nr:gene transfer agent family protein [Aureimonas glaciei]GGD30736.1 hypothetical protein GCM10011335_37230 [Aureimonas glaciei]